MSEGEKTIHCHKLFGEWRWRIKSAAGDLLAQAEFGFASREDCLADAQQKINNVS